MQVPPQGPLPGTAAGADDGGMITKRHLTITAVTAALSFGFGGSSLAPDADAAKNDGRFANSSEGMKKKQSLCDSLQGSYGDLTLIRDVARETGDRKGFSRARRDAERVKRNAIERGCSWA